MSAIKATLEAIRGRPVGWSDDLKRVLALPRRELNPEGDSRAAEAWTAHLRRERLDACDCDARFGVPGVPGSGCLKALNPVQGWALEELGDAGGLWANIGVGHGKTLISILACWALPDIKDVLLLVPAATKRQLIERDYPQCAAHFKVPHLAGHYVWPGPERRPVLRVHTYNELSLPANADLLTERIRFDLCILDEGHNAKDKKGIRWRRLMRADAKHNFKLAVLTGTPTDKSLTEYNHLLGRALLEGAPVPHEPSVVEEWASALDASPFRAPGGALRQLCNSSTEDVREGFARRVADTLGCVVTSTASVKCALSIVAVKAPKLPTEPLPGFDGASLADLLERARGGERPDGEQAIDALTSALWSRQIAAGFYSYWHFPRGEPDSLILKWLAVRKAYAKEAREKLKHAKEYLDSPELLRAAAVRWYNGYKVGSTQYPPKCSTGPLPVWASAVWPEWSVLLPQVEHETRYKWLSDYLVVPAAKWAQETKGLVWVSHKDYGRRVAALAEIPLYDGGGRNPELEERGDRSIVVTVKANATGKNLQKLWHRNLYPTPWPANKLWEQSLGRTHRQGQPADEVFAETYLHTPEFSGAFETARRRAQYVQATGKSPQKLCYANIDTKHAAQPLLVASEQPHPFAGEELDD